jgi:glycosyltransferase involved in cell wall biosynthesis
VLTAAYRLDPAHLHAAHASLLTQRAVEWEWVIQVDGPARHLPAQIAGDPRVRVAANGAHYGDAITRNRALMRCRGDYVQNLDDDDVLAPNALSALRGALDQRPDCAFAFGNGCNTDERGAALVNWRAPGGRLGPGELFDLWMDQGWRDTSFPPLAPGGVMWRRTILFAEGGWRALTGCSDTALVMSAAEKYASFGVDVPTILVREHAARSTRSRELRTTKTQHWEFIRQHVLAQRNLARP